MSSLTFFLILIFVPIFLQSSALNFLSLGNIKPDLALIVVCYIGLYQGEETGTCFGFCIGLLQDLFSAGLLGLNAMSKTLFGFLFGQAAKRFNSKNCLVQLLLVFTSSLAEGLFFLAILRVFRIPRQIHETFLDLVLPQTLYNLFLTPFFFKFIEIFRNKWGQRVGGGGL